ADTNDWHKVYSLVDGRLLRDDLQNAAGVSNGPILIAARFRASKTGSVSFHVTGAGTENPEMTIDGNPSSATAKLPGGEHSIDLHLQAHKLPDFIRVQSDAVTFLAQ